MRHAEKADGGRNPDLSSSGHDRATALANVVRDARVEAVYATQFKRTQLTVNPLAKQTNLVPIVVDADDTNGLAALIRRDHFGKVVLVAAHSNTVPRIIAALGGPPLPEIDEDTFDDLYVVTVAATTSVVHLKYR